MRGTSRRRAGRPKLLRLIEAYQQAHPVGNIRRLNPYHQAHFLRFFGRRPLTAITTESAADYALKRQAAGVAAELVNEELRALGHLVRFAAQRGELPQEPTIWFVPTAREPVRRSSNWFFEHPAAAAEAKMKIRSPSGQGSHTGAVTTNPEPRGRKQKLTAEILGQHLDHDPLDKKNPDGTPFSVNQRLPNLKKLGVELSRSQLTKRLNAYKKKMGPPA